MKSVVIPVALTNAKDIQKEVSENNIDFGQSSAAVQYSELPGTLMLGVDGNLKPLFHGPDAEINRSKII